MIPKLADKIHLFLMRSHFAIFSNHYYLHFHLEKLLRATYKTLLCEGSERVTNRK